MDARSVQFVDAMVAIAAIGVLGLLAGAAVRATSRANAGRAERATGTPWVGVVPAIVLLVVAAGLAVWLVTGGGHGAWGESIGDWQASPRAVAFTLIMLAFGLLGVVATGVYSFSQDSRRPRPVPTVLRPMPPGTAAVAPPAAAASPSGWRLIGLVLPLVGFLLACAIALPRASQYALMLQLIYPASLGLVLVLLVDKATRVWGAKAGVEAAREWLLCDLLAFFVLLGFLNLRSVPKPEAYACVFWDALNLLLLLAGFWLVDRAAARARFLAAYAYLTVVPLLLLIWRAAQGIAAPGEASWWGSIWPFLILAVVFFLLEILTLIAAGRHAIAALKDALFVVLYAALLIVAAHA